MKKLGNIFVVFNLVFYFFYPLVSLASVDSDIKSNLEKTSLNQVNQDLSNFSSALNSDQKFNSWFKTAKNKIENEEYQASLDFNTDGDKSYNFSNKKQNLLSVIDSNFWKMQNLDKQAGLGWEWSYNLDNLNRGDNFQYYFLEKNYKINSQNNLIFIEKNILTEWYKNNEDGIEQGFTIYDKPAGTGVLNIEAKIDTNLDLEKNSSTEIIFTNENKILKINNLKVVDKNNKILEASFGFDKEKNILIISVDDTEAVYPIIVDPLANTEDLLVVGDQSSSFFGSKVVTGDINADGFMDLVVGAMNYDDDEVDEGKIFVYYGSNVGVSSTADLTIESNQISAKFGGSLDLIDIDGDGFDDLFVGSSRYDGILADTGKVFLYYGSADGLNSEADDWSPEGSQASVSFASTVVSAGDVNNDGFEDVIFGDYAFNGVATDTGKVFLYYGSETGPNETPDWIMEGDQANAYFGYSISSAGDVNSDGFSDVLINSYYYSNGESKEGKVFLYHGSADGLSDSPDWTAEGNQINAYLGSKMSATGDVNGDGYGDVIIGSSMFDNGNVNEGKAFLYYGSIDGLSDSPDWTAEGNVNDAYFGTQFSFNDVNRDGFSDLLISSWKYSSDLQYEGKIFLYYGSADGLGDSPDWTAEGNQYRRHFGNSLDFADLNGDGLIDLVVSSQWYPSDANYTGAFFVYYGLAETIHSNADWAVEGEQANAYLGYSVSSAGDVNGDSYDDVIVSAWFYDNGESNEGKVFLYYGSADGLSESPDWTAEGNQINAYFGKKVSSAGDVNGDGYDDVLVGAYKYDNGETDEGKVFLYYGSADGLSESPDWTAEGDQISAYFGFFVSSVGDVNGDGYGDILVSAYLYDTNEIDEGKVFLYYGSADGLSDSPDWTAEGDQTNSAFGIMISSAGDVNGDGFSDVLISDDFFVNIEDRTGKVFLYYGSANGLSESSDWTVEGNQAGALFGFDIASAGDVNGDGFGDVAIGARSYDNGETDEGKVFLYYGSANGLSESSDWTVEGNQVSANFGRPVASAGDVNNDGFSDLIIGSYLYDSGESNEGKVFLYYGSADGLSDSSDWTAESNQSSSEFGISVDSAGDVNADGFSDIIVGAEYYNGGLVKEGKVFVYLGNGGSTTKEIKQLNLDDQIITNLGKTDSQDSFKISVKAKSFVGRTKAKLQYEVKPFGTVFTGEDLQESSEWIDTGVNGVTITEIVDDLNGGVLYHWRARLIYDNSLANHSLTWFSNNSKSWNDASLRTLPYNLIYSSASNGAVTGTLSQLLGYGESGTVITAVPDANYHFVNWSDESTDNPRQDTNVINDVSVTANFAIDTFTLSYLEGLNGSIDGNKNQVINYNNDGTSVTAVPDVTYHFVNWSDGSTENPRQDLNVTSSISVTANFAINDQGGTFMPVLTPVKIKNGNEKITADDIKIKGCVLSFPDLENIKSIAVSDASDFKNSIWNDVVNNNFELKKNFVGDYFLKFNSIDGMSTDVLKIKLNCAKQEKELVENNNSIQGPLISEDKNICNQDILNLNFKIGDRGTEVKNLQIFLNNNGFKLAEVGAGSLGNETEYFGNLSFNALNKYRQSCLNKNFENPVIKNIIDEKVGLSCQINSFLSLGSTGDEVSCLQIKLKELGYFNFSVFTGYFGPVTKEAVVAFQKANNLVPYPGWVGPATRLILNKF